MVLLVISILIILWVLGYAPITGISIPNIVLLTINSHAVTLWEVLILVVIGWAIGILPRPLQAVASVLLVVWILSVLGILAITGLSNIVVILIIVALIVSLFF